MWTIVEEARVQIVNSGFPLKLWVKSISTIVYLRIQSPSLVIQDKTITLF